MPEDSLFDPNLPLKSAMNSVKPPRFLPAILSGLVGILVLSATSPLVAQIPAGDLTVTVEETENGDVQFSLSGTAYMQQSGFISSTNSSFFPAVPPANASTYVQYLIPPGLNLTVPDSIGSEPETPEEGGSMTVNLPLSAIVSSTGNWYLTAQSSGNSLPIGSAIAGSGSITTNAVPFSFFVPGTYLVFPSVSETSEPEPAAPEEGDMNLPPRGFLPYYITYKVIPYSPEASVSKLGVSRPNTFVARVETSISQTITITNLGNTPVSGLKVEIPKSGKKNFDVTQPKLTTLAAGASTTFVATFEPESAGSKRATITITGDSASETVQLRGRALPKVNSPRFPRRPGN
jgi:hypothetical protein